MTLLSDYRIVDLSMLIEPHWRFKPEFGFKELPKPEFTFRSTVLVSYGTHNFSHCDAPRHVSQDLSTIDELELDRFCGEASLIDVCDLGDNAPLTREVLAERTAAVRPGDIVVLRSNHEQRHPTTEVEYWTKAPWLTRSGAEYLLELGVKATAFDFPQDRGIREDYDPEFVRSDDSVEDWACHSVLLPKLVLQVEYLANLADISQDRFLFFAMPLKIKGSDGGPARVYVLEEKESER